VLEADGHDHSSVAQAVVVRGSLIGHSGCISQTQIAESVCDPNTSNGRARRQFWRVAELAAMQDARSV
jgi:hypothetical protein